MSAPTADAVVAISASGSDGTAGALAGGESISRRRLCFAGFVPCQKRCTHLIEKSGRQEAVIVTIDVRDLAQIVSRPEEFIAFAHDDP